MHRQILLASGFLLLTGCIAPYLSPMTYRCSGAPELPKSFVKKLGDRYPDSDLLLPGLPRWLLLPGVEPGMTREQVRKSYQELLHDPDIAAGVTLDDSDPDLFYFLTGTCPRLRYRFKNNHLVAVGGLDMEMGVLHFRDMDYTETRCELSLTKTGYHWFRTTPKYDDHGDFIGVERTDDGPHTWTNYCEGMKPRGK